MNSQDLQGLQEAYSEVVEGMSMKDFKANRKKIQRKESSTDARRRGHEGSEWHNTGKTYSPDEAKANRAKMSDPERAARHRAAVDPDDDRDENMYSADKTKNPKKLRKQKAMGELGEEYIDEAEGSYGQTPKATAAYAKLGNERRMKPASEYPQRGAKKKAVSDAERHERTSRTTDAGNRGKKSTKPSWHSHQRHQMTQSDRDHLRGQSEYGHIGYDPDGDGGPSGPGGMPKGKKLARQKKTGVSAESYNAYETVFEYLLDEGFASTEQAADKIILNMSEAWFEDIMELNRYEKEKGKDYKTGKPVTKGGTLGGDDTNSKVMRHMHKVMGAGRMGAGGAIQPRGKKKEKGKKPPAAGEYGGPASPAQKVAKRRAAAQQAQDLMHSRYD